VRCRTDEDTGVAGDRTVAKQISLSMQTDRNSLSALSRGARTLNIADLRQSCPAWYDPSGQSFKGHPS